MANKFDLIWFDLIWLLIAVIITSMSVLVILGNVRWAHRVLSPGESRWVCTAQPSKIGKRWSRQRDGRQTDALLLMLDEASVIIFLVTESIFLSIWLSIAEGLNHFVIAGISFTKWMAEIMDFLFKPWHHHFSPHCETTQYHKIWSAEQDWKSMAYRLLATEQLHISRWPAASEAESLNAHTAVVKVRGYKGAEPPPRFLTPPLSQCLAPPHHETWP